MYNFSVKDSLLKLQEKNYDININSTINMLVEKFDEDQLRILSQYQGLKIDNNLIRLFFIENVGFRCLNDKDNIYGKMPICQNIEKYMNKLYLESFENPEFKIGDYVKLTNSLYLMATICRMNNVTLDTIFQVVDYQKYNNYYEDSETPYMIHLLNNNIIDYIWVSEKDIKIASEEEVLASKYNL